MPISGAVILLPNFYLDSKQSLPLKLANEMKFCSAAGELLSPSGMKAVTKVATRCVHNSECNLSEFSCLLTIVRFEIEAFARVTKAHQSDSLE